MRCYWWEGKNTGKYKGERERGGVRIGMIKKYEKSIKLRKL